MCSQYSVFTRVKNPGAMSDWNGFAKAALIDFGCNVFQDLHQQMALMQLGSGLAAAKEDPFGGSAVWGS